jgi:hypothetical protein
MPRNAGLIGPLAIAPTAVVASGVYGLAGQQQAAAWPDAYNRLILIKAWGAAGGPGLSSNSGAVEGGGGYATATFSITKGTTLAVQVGGSTSNHLGGWPNGGDTADYGGSGGGGRSDVKIGSDILCIAGGGGGCGYNTAVSPAVASGGPGGGATGGDGTASSPGTQKGLGGTSSAGGAGGTSSIYNLESAAADGGSLAGGDGGWGWVSTQEYARCGGGGGGDGYYGGGGGNPGGTSNATRAGGGGGGGSAYANTGYSGYSASTLTAGSTSSSGNAGDSDKPSNSGLTGRHGVVVIYQDGVKVATLAYTGSGQTYVVTA